MTLVAKHFDENITNLAFTNLKSLCQNYQIQHCQIATLTLAAKHLDENIKNPALTNPAFTAASHFAGIPKSSITKLPNLHWRQSTLMKISKSGIHKPNIHSGKSHCMNYQIW